MGSRVSLSGETAHEGGKENEGGHQGGEATDEVTMENKKSLPVTQSDLAFKNLRLPPERAGNNLAGRIDNGGNARVGASGDPASRLNGTKA